MLIYYRLELEQQHCVSTSGYISRKQEDWEVKWKGFLDLCPFNFSLSQYTVSGVQFIWFWGIGRVKVREDIHLSWCVLLQNLSFICKVRESVRYSINCFMK